ncbi:hypothetical protein AVEN_253725-1 [Araneus ventricosus]|uniref:Uncharacterized protein n=1 Tax=Araneus ventricosus TaxID=182803 RepID=A0A4Y2DZ39_ARAVE|nr:hypothetical protein AVEN_253725-1 [Araneus ventricosus]
MKDRMEKGQEEMKDRSGRKDKRNRIEWRKDKRNEERTRRNEESDPITRRKTDERRDGRSQESLQVLAIDVERLMSLAFAEYPQDVRGQPSSPYFSTLSEMKILSTQQG